MNYSPLQGEEGLGNLVDLKIAVTDRYDLDAVLAASDDMHLAERGIGADQQDRPSRVEMNGRRGEVIAYQVQPAVPRAPLVQQP